MKRQTMIAASLFAMAVATAQEQPFFINHTAGGTSSFSRAHDGWVTNATFSAHEGFTIQAITSGRTWSNLAATTSATNIAYPMPRVSALYGPKSGGGRLSADLDAEFATVHEYLTEIILGADVPKEYELLCVTAHVLISSQSATNFKQNAAEVQIGDGEPAVDLFDSETTFGEIYPVWHLIDVPIPNTGLKAGDAAALKITVHPGDYVAFARAVKIHSLWVRPAELRLDPPSAVEYSPAVLTVRSCPGLPLIIETAPCPEGPWIRVERRLVPGSGVVNWTDALSTVEPVRFYRSATLVR